MRDDLDLGYRVSELERCLHNLLRLGTVAELDEATATVRVQSGKLKTAWLPWLTRRAGGDRDWWAPEVGEQVMILSPSGDLAQGVVLPGLYRDAHPAPAASRDIRRIDMADGAFIEYDRASGRLMVSAEGLARLIGKGTVEIVGADQAPVKGIVQGDCICAYTGQLHPMVSGTVKSSK